MNPEEVTELFNQVKKTFFSRWDKAERWRLKVLPSGSEKLHNAHGICINETREILVNRGICRLGEREEIELLFIHEICHAVAGSSHRQTFFTRMEKAEKSAEKMGRTSLAELIRDEVEGYKLAPPVGFCQLVYGYINEAVLVNGVRDFDGLIQLIAEEVASSPDEILRRCTRYRKMFDKALRERKRYETAQAKLRMILSA